jgi:hypothetical protein
MFRSALNRIDDPSLGAVRARRVALALGIIWSLSIFDLALTTAFMTTSGMIESNPLARAVVLWRDSTYPLVAWKVLCTALCTVILTSLRRRVAAEGAAWLCVAALGLTTITWVQYLQCEEVQLLSSLSVTLPEAPDGWVALNR